MSSKPKRLSDKPIEELNSEHLQQAALIDWTNRSEINAQYPLLQYLFAIPNGGDRAMAVAVKLKAEGVKKGVPDLFLPIPNNRHYGFWVEMKYGRNTTSKEQREFLEMMMTQGYKTGVYYDWREARDDLIEYLGGTNV